jgi:LuxR family transcriptional regulator, maltose regulon positive regulatory protein
VRPAAAPVRRGLLLPFAKLSRPKLQRVVPRDRLFRELDQARSRPIVWIGGLPGAGKTTLVASYLQARQHSAVWYQLDAGDGDLASFFYHLGLAVPERRGGDGGSLPLLAPEYLGGTQTFARGYFRQLLARFKAPFALVLDDYHEVPPDSPLHAALSAGLSEIPDGANALLIGRAEPPAEFARLRANGRVAIVPGERLRLTPAEVAEIARLRGRTAGARRRAPKLGAQTDGWAAGVVLGLECDDPLHAPAGCAVDGAPQAIFDYFAAEVFDRSDSDTRQVLLETSPLPTTTARLAAEVTGLPQAGRILAELARKSFFTTRHADAEPVFRYHPLFLQFLRVRASESVSADRRAELRRRGARALRAAGQVEEAVELFAEARAWDELGELLTAHAPGVLASGRGESLARWIGAIPGEQLRDAPWLLYWMGIATLPRDVNQARRHLEDAFELLSSRGDGAGAYVAWAGVVESYLLAFADFAPLDRWIGELELLRERFPSFPSDTIAARVSCMAFGALVFRQPHHSSLQEWEERTLGVARQFPDVRLRVTAATALVQHWVWSGQHGRARTLVHSLRPAVAGGLDPLSTILWDGAEALFWWVSGEPERSIEAARRGLAIATTTGIRFWDAILLSQQAWASLAANRIEDAVASLDKMASAVRPGQHVLASLHRCIAGAAALRAGDALRALEDECAAAALANEGGMPFASALLELVLGEMFLQRDDREAAAGRFAAAAASARSGRSELVRYLVGLGRARHALAGGDEKRAVADLRESFAIGRDQGVSAFGPWLGPTQVAELCAVAIANGIETEHVRQIVRSARLPAPAAAAVLEDWPWPLAIRTLGRFELLRDGVPVDLHAKGHGRPLQLLKVLVSLGGRRSRMETVAEAMWPDAEGDVAHHALETTLYRLRKILGGEDVVRVVDCTVTIEPTRCWIDAIAFERLASRASGSSASPAMAARALGMYAGEFLPDDVDASWSQAPRTRLARLHGELVRRADRAAGPGGASARSFAVR